MWPRGPASAAQDDGGAGAAFSGRISRRLGIAVGAGFLLILLVGGLSSIYSWAILRSTGEVNTERSHIETTDEIHALLHHLIRELDRAILLRSLDRRPHIEALREEIGTTIERFLVVHLREEEPFPEKKQEIELIRELEAVFGELNARIPDFLERIDAGEPPRPKDLALLDTVAHRTPELVATLNAVHRNKASREIEGAARRMRFIIAAYVAFLVLGTLGIAAGMLVFTRTISAPLRRLATATAAIARGDFGGRVPITSRDEIGILAQSFNRMAEALAGRDAQVRRSAQEAEALHRVGTEISSLLQIDRVITSVVESARALFEADAAGLALADGPAQEIRWTVFAGAHGGAFREVRVLPGEGVAGRVVATGEPVALEDAAREIANDPESHPILAAEQLTAALAVPLRRGERTLGALMVAYRTPRRFTEDETTLLSSFANQVAVAVENAELYKQVQALHRVGMEVSSSLNLGRILRTVVESARSILRTDVAALCLLRDGGPHMDVPAVAGPWNEVMGALPEQCCDDPAAGFDVCLRCKEAHRQRDVGHLSVPLRRGDQMMGALCVGSAAPRTFGEAERVLLGGLAAQATIAIENARLVEGMRGMAAVEERERLAREMHDGLAQALGVLNLKLAVAERTVEGTAEAIRPALREMRKVAGEAYEEVRQAIFGLRTMVSRGLGLIPTLSEYLHEFSQQAGLEVKLEAREEDGLARLAPEVEVQLVRIVQEALHNVRKHAGARAAWVRFRREGDDLVMAIEDDGAGFDPSAPVADGRKHFGLMTMRERAEAVGGALAVRSAAGTGTQVVVRLPLTAGRREGNGTARRHEPWNAPA